MSCQCWLKKMSALTAVWKPIFFIFILSGVAGLRVHVRVDEDDDGETEEYNQDYRLYNSLDPEDPPFQVPEVSPVYKVTDHTFSVDENIRKKRDSVALGEFKNLPMSYCISWARRIYGYTNQRPLHMSRVLAINETIQIPCYYCGSPEIYKPPLKVGTSHQWIHLARNKTDGYWTMRPVVGDKEFGSRANITSNFTLIIRNIQERDTGMYNCAIWKGKQLLYKFSDKQLKTFLTGKNRNVLKLYFHIDVKLPSDIPVIQVSNTDPAFPLPAPRVKDKDSNLEFSTYWGDWSTCSVCGEEGERWRKGVCWVNMIKRDVMMYPPYIHSILSTVEYGIPCSASLFKLYPKMPKLGRPDEKMFKSCNVTCTNRTLTDRMSSNLEKLKFQSLANAPHKNIAVTEGDSVTLKCPGVSLDTVVYWVNGSEYLTSLRLRNITNQRADIDVYGVLRFHSTVVADSGFYSCWHTKKRQIVYALTVVPVDTNGDWLYHMKFVCLSFVFDTVIFIALMFVKQKHRHVNQPRRRRKADNNDENDDEPYNVNYNNIYGDSSDEEWDVYNEGHFG